MSAIVEVKLELGHRAKVRDVPSLEGHTHDWVVFVKGTDKIRLEYFVERVVFWLHESYEQHRRVIKTPPYKVEQSGFAGFNMLIDVHFRNREEPKMVRFQYDLFLHTEAMPPVNHTRLEKLTFTNPTEDFRKKLVDAGAMLINNPLPKHSRDHSKERTSISPSMKERSKSRDSSKRRDNSQSSSSRSSDDKKRPSSSSSSHVGKKDGRIPGKDMKKHEDAFKHPKPPEVSVKSSHKDSPSGEKERGRAEKRRSIADDDGSKKKKKRHSDDVPSPSSGSSQSRPKSLPVSTKPQNPPKKEKPKKIREKTDIMAGLFAPENSINMTQIKQSKEKSKSESSDVRLSKKEKRSNVTPSRKSVSPHPNQEEVNVVQSTKISPTGNITLKIKKERITSAEKEKKESKSLNESVKVKKKDPEKQKSKLSPIESTKVKRETIKVKEVKKRSPSTSSDTSSSSSSPSDMDISSDSDSGDAVVTHKTKILHKSKKESEKHESKSKITTSHREKITEKQPEKPTLNSSRGSKFEKIKAEKNSPAHSSDKVKVKVEKRAEKMSSSFNTSGKERKLSVGDNTTLDKSRDTSTTSEHRKSRKQKRSSKEKAPRKSSETKTSTPNVVKKEKQRSTPNSSSQNLDRFSSSKKEYHNSPSDYSSMSPVQSSKSTPKSPKKLSNSSLVSSEKKEKERNKKSFNTEKKMKPQTKKQLPKSTSKVEDRPKPVYKSRSFVETSSSDSDDEIRPPAEVSSMVETSGYPRKDSVSSSSSTSSSSSARSHQEETKPLVPVPDPMDKVDSPVSSSSTDTSSDDDIEMSEIPKNTSTMSVLSPIRDDAPSIIGKTLDSTAPFGNMSESSDNDDNSSTGQQSPTDMNRSFHPLHDDALSSSEEEDQSSPPETPFQNLVQTPEMSNAVEEEKPPSQPNVIILTGQDGHYPHMTESLYRELQDLQKRISYVTDVERLRKIARIVAKSQKLLKNDDYFDFDLCSLDNRTIHKIQKQLEAV